MITTESIFEMLADLGIEIWAEGERLRFRAPEGALSPDLRIQLRNRRDELLATLRRRGSDERYSSPVSWTQLGLWLVHQAAPESAAYHVAFSARITSAVNVDALRASLQALVDRHAILRTTYAAGDDRPCQVVVGYQEVDFERIGVPAETDDDLRELVRTTYERPFDLSRDSMMRARLFTRSAEDHVLLLVWSHIAVDGWSTWILLDELRALYESHASGGPAALSRPTSQYRDFAKWQADLLDGPEGTRLWNYWHERLAGAQPLSLPTDRIPASSSSTSGRTLTWQVGGDRLERLKSLAAAERASLFVVLLAVFKTLLYRYTGQVDLLIGTPTFGRSRPEFHDLVGDLVNTVPLRTDLSGSITFRELVSRVRETTLGALAHADYPFALLVRRLGVRREAGRAPLFNVLFNFQTPQRSNDLLELFLPSDPPATVTTAGLSLEPYLMPQQEGQFDLSLELIELDGKLRGNFKYRSDLFDETTIDRMTGHWSRLIDVVLTDPDAQIANLPLLTERERKQLVHEWNDTALAVEGPLTLHGPFEACAAATPNAVAVVDAQTSLTYGELNRLAINVASHLRQRGAGPGARVGIAIDRSVKMVAALLGILKTGAAYVPLDPSYPPERLSYMVNDSGVALVLIEHSANGDRTPNSSPSALYLEECLQAAADPAATVPVAADGEAYVIYTSGSTGQPKGVVVSHRSVATMLHAFRKRFVIASDDRWVALATLSFDISVLEVFGPLSCGACAYIASREDARDGTQLTALIDAWQPTFLQATPSTWRMVLDAEWSGASGLTIIAGGEALLPELAARLRLRCSRLFNGYGPTEATIYATAAEVPDSPSQITIGRPLANVTTYVLDSSGEPVPVGLPGELYIGGAGVAMGYHARETLTAERFVPDPFSTLKGARMYRTGDLVRWRADGQLEYLGRLDNQVKVRGHRIELGEIENALERHPAVRRSVVVAQATRDGDRVLVAYVVPAGEIETGDLRRFLRDHLPDYMIPSFFHQLERFPLTPSGKIDRNRLPVKELEQTRNIVAPRTDLEATLTGLWEEALDIRPIGVTDNFFDLGGHSLLAARLCAQISEQTGRRLHVATFFQTPTVAEQAAQLNEQSMESEGLLVPLRTQGASTPFFCVPGAGDNPFIFADVARHLAGDRPVYSFRFPDEARAMRSQPHELVATVARRLVDRVRSVQPKGPYLLGGYCFGGLVAFEMAQQLHDQGETVGALTIFEMFLPGAFRMPTATDRVAYHLRFLRSVGWRDRIGFVKRHGRRRLARIGRQLSPRLRDAVAQLTSPPVDDFIPHRAYAGRLTLFRGSTQPDGLTFDHDMGWGGLASQGVVVHEIDGHHTDAYKEPSISKWISILRDILDQADSQNGEASAPRLQSPRMSTR